MKTLPQKNTRKTPVRKATGKGGIMPPGGRGFDVAGQPSSESKKAGWAKKKSGRDLVIAFFETPFSATTPAAKSKLQKFANAYGLQPEEVTVELMAIHAQVEKAVLNGDTYAFRNLMDRAYGLPKQVITTTKVGLDLAEEQEIYE